MIPVIFNSKTKIFITIDRGFWISQTTEKHLNYIKAELIKYINQPDLKLQINRTVIGDLNEKNIDLLLRELEFYYHVSLDSIIDGEIYSDIMKNHDILPTTIDRNKIKYYPHMVDFIQDVCSADVFLKDYLLDYYRKDYNDEYGYKLFNEIKRKIKYINKNDYHLLGKGIYYYPVKPKSFLTILIKSICKHF